MKFAKKVHMLRTQKGWSQEDLAQRLGVNKRTISTYENGVYPRYQHTYDELAAIFGVETAYLRNEDEVFFTEAAEQHGLRGQMRAQHILDQTAPLFAGGELSDEDEIAFLHELQGLYLDSKKRASEKFSPKSRRNDVSGQ